MKALFILLVLLASLSNAHSYDKFDVEIKGVVSVESHIDIADFPLDNEGDELLTKLTSFKTSLWGDNNVAESNYSVFSQPLTAYSIRAPPVSSFISL